MAVYQRNDVTNPAWVLEQLEGMLPDDSWVGAATTRAVTMLRLHKLEQIDNQALAFNLSNIRKVTQDHPLYEDSLRKNRLDEILNPLIDKLKESNNAN
jgi:hypothetical protein